MIRSNEVESGGHSPLPRDLTLFIGKPFKRLLKKTIKRQKPEELERLIVSWGKREITLVLPGNTTQELLALPFGFREPGYLEIRISENPDRQILKYSPQSTS
jgi:hypothetical protein